MYFIFSWKKNQNVKVNVLLVYHVYDWVTAALWKEVQCTIVESDHNMVIFLAHMLKNHIIRRKALYIWHSWDNQVLKSPALGNKKLYCANKIFK